MSTRPGLEVPSGGIPFPVAIVSEGVDDLALLTGLGGNREAPDSVILQYDAERILARTYPKVTRSEFEVERSLAEVLESYFSRAWESRELGSPKLDVVNTERIPAEGAYIEARTYAPLGHEETERRQQLRTEAASKADHRQIELSLGASLVEAMVVGGADMWAAGFEMPWEGGTLEILLTGGSVPFDSLKLELVDDLLPHLRA